METIDKIVKMLNDRLTVLENDKKRNKDKWNYYELDKHKARVSEIIRLLKNINENSL